MSFETAKKGPLEGRKVVVTRTAEQAGSFVSILRAEGAEVIEFPTIETVPPEDFSGLDSAIERLPRFDYIIFTSANALKYFLARLEKLGRPSSLLRESRLVAVGPKTAQEMAASGLKPDIIPEEYKAEGVLAALEDVDITGKSFLYPRALEARVKIEARAIKEKYVDPPHTTDFAILFLPVEGLFAEVERAFAQASGAAVTSTTSARPA